MGIERHPDLIPDPEEEAAEETERLAAKLRAMMCRCPGCCANRIPCDSPFTQEDFLCDICRAALASDGEYAPHCHLNPNPIGSRTWVRRGGLGPRINLDRLRFNSDGSIEIRRGDL
jgi:hypothetical protein